KPIGGDALRGRRLLDDGRGDETIERGPAAVVDRLVGRRLARTVELPPRLIELLHGHHAIANASRNLRHRLLLRACRIGSERTGAQCGKHPDSSDPPCQPPSPYQPHSPTRPFMASHTIA